MNSKKKKVDHSFSGGMIPPQAVDFEEIVLGAIMIESKCFDLIREDFHCELFYKDAHQKLAAAIIELKNKGFPVDILTVSNELKRTENLDFVGGPYYISQLTNRVASTANIEYHTKILQQFYTKRKAIELCSIIIRDAYDPQADIFDMIDASEKMLTELSSRIITSNIVDSGQLAILTHKKNYVLRETKGISGVSAGLVDLDKKVGGWQNGDLIILAARPSMGKTALATQLLLNPAISIDKRPTAIFSLEMSNEQLYFRMKSQKSGIELYKFTKVGLNDPEMDYCDGVCKSLYHGPIYFDDTGGVDIFNLKNKARKLKREKKIELLIIDYLQLITVKDHRGSREQEVSQISRELKALAKELNIPIICLSQLSRKCEEREDKRPFLSDLRESGSIEQDADVVLFIYRPEYYKIFVDEFNNSTLGKAMIIVAKNRNGSIGEVVTKWVGERTSFYDNSYIDEPLEIEKLVYPEAPKMQPNANFDEPF